MENEIQPEQKKKWYKKWWVMLIFAFLLLLIIFPTQILYAIGYTAGKIVSIFK